MNHRPLLGVLVVILGSPCAQPDARGGGGLASGIAAGLPPGDPACRCFSGESFRPAAPCCWSVLTLPTIGLLERAGPARASAQGWVAGLRGLTSRACWWPARPGVSACGMLGQDPGGHAQTVRPLLAPHGRGSPRSAGHCRSHGAQREEAGTPPGGDRKWRASSAEDRVHRLRRVLLIQAFLARNDVLEPW